MKKKLGSSSVSLGASIDASPKLPLSSSSEKSSSKGKKGSKKITAKHRKILAHLKGQNNMKAHEDKLQEAERRKSETKNDSSTILILKKKSRRKSLGMENHLSRQQNELNLKVKQRIKKIMTIPKQTNPSLGVDQFWMHFGPLMYKDDPLVCPSTSFG